MAGGRVYVVNSLICALSATAAGDSFWFIEGKFTAMLGELSTDATDILLENVKPGSDGSSLLVEGLKVTHQVMMPGEAINEMNRTAAHATTSALDRFEESKHTRRIDLWA